MKFRSKHPFPETEMEWSSSDGSEPIGDFASAVAPLAERDILPKARHPDAVEKGVELALGFLPHRGENRRTRRAAVANWQPPAVSSNGRTPGFDPDNEGSNPPAATPPRMPTRRELLGQRQRQRRGRLDPELRRLQHEQRKAKR